MRFVSFKGIMSFDRTLKEKYLDEVLAPGSKKFEKKKKKMSGPGRN